jgi:hypothetical protein
MAARHIQQRLTARLDEPAPAPTRGIPPARPSRVQLLHEYWQRKRGVRSMPARADIEPSEIKPLLPYVIIADVFADPVRVRYRLAGTAVSDAFGCNIAGRWLDELDVNGGVDFWIEQYGRMIASRVPIFGRACGTASGVELFRADWALFPLSRDGLRVDQCLEMEDWIKGNPTADYSDSRVVWSVEPLA